MKLNELFSVFEGRDAPLYHGTGFFNAAKAIEEDRLAARTTHVFDDGEVLGVSLSRQLASSFMFGNVLFSLNQRALSHRFRIRPTDYWGTSHEPVLAGSGRRKDHYAEAEEFVIGEIKPLEVYLNAILIRPQHHAMMEKEAGQSGFQIYRTILDHPLLKIV